MINWDVMQYFFGRVLVFFWMKEMGKNNKQRTTIEEENDVINNRITILMFLTHALNITN